MSFLGLTLVDFKQMFKIFRINLRNRFLGSRLGFVWAVLNPLLLMMVYVIVFGFVMKIQISADSSPMDYLIWFISGFAPWLAINDGITSGANAIVANISLVKNYPIRSEILPIASSLMGSVQMLVGIALVIVLSLATGVGVSINIFWLLLVIPIMFAFLAGVSFFLSVFTVFLRDLNQVISTILVFLLFFTPLFYTLEQLPLIVQQVTFFNPIYQMTDPFRRVLYDHQPIDLWGLLYLLVITAVLWVAGLWYFRRRKGLFESAL